MVKVSGTTGNEIFTVQGGFSFHYDTLHDAKVDSAGDVVVVGSSGFEDRLDFLVLKLSGTNGSVLWEYSPSSGTIDVLLAVDIDEQDNVYVAGGEDAQNLQGDIAESPLVIKLSGTNGTVEWTYSNTSTSRTIFRSVAVDPTTGWVVGAGHTEGTWLAGGGQGGYDFAATVLDGDSGQELARYQNGTDGNDVIRFAGFNSTGALFFGGYTSDNVGENDLVGVKFSPLGEIMPTPSPTTPPTIPPTTPPTTPPATPPTTPPMIPLTIPPTTPPTTPLTTPPMVPPTITPTIPPTTPSTIPPTPSPTTPPISVVSYMPVVSTPAPLVLTSTLVSPTPAPLSSSPAPMPLTLSPVPLTTAPALPTPGPISPSLSPFPAPAPTLVPTPSPTPVPTSVNADGAVLLDEWQIGAITAGTSLLLVILGICMYCCHIGRTRNKADASGAKMRRSAQGWSLRTIAPISDFGPRPQPDALPSRRLPTYRSEFLRYLRPWKQRSHHPLTGTSLPQKRIPQLQLKNHG
ncbi:unnamed protein product [Ascophyllum nodosum]